MARSSTTSFSAPLWVYSEFGQNFLKTMLRLAETRGELRVVADQHGSPTSAREIAEAILHLAPLLVRDQKLSGRYHFTAEGFYNVAWFCQPGRRNRGADDRPESARVIPIRTADYPTPAKRPANSRLDCGLFVRTFRLHPASLD